MKRRVEHRHLRHAWAEHGARRGDAPQVVRVVQRREFDQLLEAAPHLVVDARGLRECLAAVHDTVSHGLDLADLGDRHARFGAREPRDDVLDRRGKIANRRGALRPADVAIAWQRENRFAADALDWPRASRRSLALGNGCLVGVDQLELERRRTNVQDENVHGSSCL